MAIAILDMSVHHSSGGAVRGPVIPQQLAAPRFQSGRTRLQAARLELPIFFRREGNGAPGVSVADALSGCLRLQGMADPARLGGKSSTYICINVRCSVLIHVDDHTHDLAWYSGLDFRTIEGRSKRETRLSARIPSRWLDLRSTWGVVSSSSAR